MTQDPHQRRNLLVLPSVEEQRTRPIQFGYLILSPPPLAMPWGLGTTRRVDGSGEDITDGWLLDEHEGEPVDLNERAGMFLRKNAYYAEIPFESDGIFSLMLPWVYFCIFCFALGYAFSEPLAFWVGLGAIAMQAVVLYFEYEKYPNVIFNRLRNEIYLHRQGEKKIIIKNFNTSVFVFYVNGAWANLDILCEKTKDINEETLSQIAPTQGIINDDDYFNTGGIIEGENLFRIDGARGLVSMIPAWEYIRRYMEPGDGYTLLPSYKDFFSFLPFMDLALRLDEEWFSPPHRWPPEIERLLWPENKDAPLPNGWQYDTWIPYDIPEGGFDNTELLREREERLRQEAEKSV